jgi:hypothetical protein
MSKINWHRLFGLSLIDLFTDTNYQVELEKELSLKKQYIDVVILKQTQGIPLTNPPVGLNSLREHNLLTYKSLHEPLDDWAVEELIGHYSNYRKVVSPSLDNLLPASHFQLLAVTTRYPKGLLRAPLVWQPLQDGVIQLTWGTRQIRVIILNQVAMAPANAFWLLFSGQANNFSYGDEHYRWRRPSERAVLKQLYELYQHEGVVMSYTMTDFERDYTREHLHLLSATEILNRFSVAERLQDLPAEAILKHFAPEERLQGLPAETILNQLSPAEIAAYLAKVTRKD